MTATRQYDAFGNLDANFTSGTFTGLKQVGHRFYDSSTGKFLTKYPAYHGENGFNYCDNYPIKRVDPIGLNHREEKFGYARERKQQAFSPLEEGDLFFPP